MEDKLPSQAPLIFTARQERMISAVLPGFRVAVARFFE
jgi:hypothetical protein